MRRGQAHAKRIRGTLRGLARVEDRLESFPPAAGLEVLRGHASRFQARPREVAPSHGEVPVHIPEDVGELEAFSKADSQLAHSRHVPRREGRNVGHLKIRPELPHAPGHVVRVKVEVFLPLERLDFPALLRRKAPEVHLHAPGEGGDELPDEGAVMVAESAMSGKALPEPEEQRLLLGDGLGCADLRGDPLQLFLARGGRLELRAKPLQVLQSRVPGEEARVGYGVGGPAEEVRHAQLLSHGARRHSEGEEDAPGHPPQDRVQRASGDGAEHLEHPSADPVDLQEASPYHAFPAAGRHGLGFAVDDDLE
jgi:hypothetical protein